VQKLSHLSKGFILRLQLGRHAAGAAAALVFAVAPVHAQNGGDDSERQPASQRPDQPTQPVSVVDPYTLHDLGLTVLLPENTVVDTQFVRGGRTKSVLKAPDDTWVIQIFNANSSDTNLSITQVLDNFEEQRRSGLMAYQNANPRMFQGADPKFYTDDDRGKSPLVVSGRKDPPNLTIAGQQAGRFYCETPLINPNLVTGYTVFRLKPGQFIIFQLDCMDKSFAHSHRVYETIVASATFEDADAENADRATALIGGRNFLESVSNEDIEAVLSDEPRYYRIYRPAPTGLETDATEVGWQRVQMRLGQRGEVDPAHSRDRWTAADREYGYLVKFDAVITQQGVDYESRASYFLDRNRTNEVISILNRIIEKDKPTWSINMTVVRRGSMLTLNSVETGSAGETRDWTVPDEYISRVELELLPRLVALKNPENSAVEYDFGYFHFNINSRAIQIRRDRFSNTDLVSGWEYITQPSPNGQSISAVLNHEGELVRRRSPDGVVTEEISLDRLRELRNDNRIGN